MELSSSGGMEAWRYRVLEVWRSACVEGGTEVWRYGEDMMLWRYKGVEVCSYGGMEEWRYGGMRV
jgi:hypothetical protein